jgi:hypothetical protein
VPAQDLDAALVDHTDDTVISDAPPADEGVSRLDS